MNATDLPLCMGLFMNPSGDGSGQRISDATVSKFGRITRNLGFGGLFVGNVCGYRARDRMRLLSVADPVGPNNFRALLEMAAESALIIAAHGQLPGKLQMYADQAVFGLRAAGYKLHVLGFAGENDDVPIHPLSRGKKFVPETVVPQEWLVEGNRLAE